MSKLGIAIFVISALAGGVYRGLQDCFGANIIAGYRRHRASLNHANKVFRETTLRHTGRTFRSAHEYWAYLASRTAPESGTEPPRKR